MKHNRLLWFLCLLICINLAACNLTRKTDVRIKSVTISPRSASVGATFSVTVQFFEHNDNSDDIHCDETTDYDKVRVYQHSIGASDTSQTFTFQYSYNPGQHFLICGTESGSSQAQPVGFRVVSGSEATATQPPVALDQFKTATLSYLSLDAPGTGGPPYWCFTGDVAGGNPIPPLSIAPDGTLTGLCKGSFNYPGGTQVSYSGTTNGNWNTQTGIVTWEMDMSFQDRLVDESGVSYSATTIIKIHDSAPITTASDGVVSAQGKAEWTASCNSSATVGPGCPASDRSGTSYNYHGTLDWKMTFNP